MLQNNLFTFFNLQTNANLVTAAIELNAAHSIFMGHFPQQPILPGACMVQMVKEVVAAYADKEIKLLKANNIKFLSFVDPNQNELMQLEFELKTLDTQLSVDARLLQSTNVVFKFKGVFVAL